MLESMVTAAAPTRAEVSDVANSVLDGTDAVMLSAESAVGAHPVAAVEMMSSICRNAEAAARLLHGRRLGASIRRHPETLFVGQLKVSEFAHCIADAAVDAAEQGQANAIIAFTTTTDMAIFVSKRRPSMAVVAVTPTGSVFRRLALHFGVHAVQSRGLLVRAAGGRGASKLKPGDGADGAVVGLPADSNSDAILAQAEADVAASASAARVAGLQEGCPVVFCAGFHRFFPGLSNTVKMGHFGDALKTAAGRRRAAEAASAAARQ
ncbi:hypothetical protein HK405_009001 [Cladochytrium tenue]|nr:hypothetical protein HK405_009001 [Cladochytrium tenue]